MAKDPLLVTQVLNRLKPDLWLTATEMAERIGQPVPGVASCLAKLYKRGRIQRKDGVGPRGGNGYRLLQAQTPGKPWYERLDSDL